MSAPSVAELYAFYDVLSGDGATPEERENAFKSILLGAKGSEKEKLLACQFIARFSKQFDNLKEESFNCILDICDDENPAVRKQAVHDLLQFSKRLPSFIPRVADVFVQMLQTDDTSELHVLSLSLSQLLHMDPKPTLAGVFNQLLTVNAENPREHIFKFLVERLKFVPEDKMTNDVEEFITEQANKVLRDVSEEEFPLIIGILSSLKCMSTVLGRQKLVTMITEQALQACPDFNGSDPACVAQIRESSKQAALCVSKNVHARELFMYLLSKVLPKITEIPEILAEDRLALLRVTAELSMSHGTDLASLEESDLELYLSSAFNGLVHFLPEVPESLESEETTDPANQSNTKLTVFDNIKFSDLECLLCICCQLGKVKPVYFGGQASETGSKSSQAELGSSRLRMLRPRLQYLSRLAQDYAQSLAVAVNQNGTSEETKDKVLAHRLATNIQTFVRSFFHNPPVFKHSVTLSWSSPISAVVAPNLKRPATLPNQNQSGSDSTGKTRREQPRYVPPAGQWSGRTQGFRGTNAFQFNRRGRGRRW